MEIGFLFWPYEPGLDRVMFSVSLASNPASTVTAARFKFSQAVCCPCLYGGSGCFGAIPDTNHALSRHAPRSGVSTTFFCFFFLRRHGTFRPMAGGWIDSATRRLNGTLYVGVAGDLPRKGHRTLVPRRRDPPDPRTEPGGLPVDCPWIDGKKKKESRGYPAARGMTGEGAVGIQDTTGTPGTTVWSGLQTACGNFNRTPVAERGIHDFLLRFLFTP